MDLPALPGRRLKMAALPRFFVPAGSLAGETALIGGETLHHLRTVLRLAPGAEVLLCDGEGTLCRVRLDTLGREQGTATVLERWREEERCCPLRLLQGLPKGDKFELVLQKGTELGIGIFQPVLCARSVARPDGRRGERWQRIADEAARQSRRPCLPRVEAPQALADALARVSEPLRLVLWEEGTRPLRAVLPEQAPAGVALLVGPEGGLTAAEVAAAEAAGFMAVHLGPRILRTETASLAVAAVLEYLYGDWGCAPGEPGGD